MRSLSRRHTYSVGARVSRSPRRKRRERNATRRHRATVGHDTNAHIAVSSSGGRAMSEAELTTSDGVGDGIDAE